MFADETPESHVMARLPPRVREKAYRLLDEDRARNSWAADHAPDGPGCERHRPRSLPQGGTPGFLDAYMAEDDVPTGSEDDSAYLRRWYYSAVEGERARRVVVADAEALAARLAAHAKAHGLDEIGVIDHPTELHADPNFRGGAHLHVEVRNGETAPRHTVTYVERAEYRRRLAEHRAGAN